MGLEEPKVQRSFSTIFIENGYDEFTMAYLVENFNSWNQTQAQFRELLAINDEKIRCLPYHGLGHALTDLLYGLKEFWPTRKNIAFSSSGSPLIKEAIQGFVREGSTILNLAPPRTNTVEEWLNALPKDLLTVVLVRDHCLTGQILARDEEFIKLNEKRIPYLEVQYGWGFSHSQPPLPFGAQIKVIDAEKAVVVLGHRFRMVAHSANLMNWTSLRWEQDIKEAKTQSRESVEWISDFERNLEILQPSIKSFFTLNSSRLFDRSVLTLENINGDFFLDELLKHLGQPPLAAAGFETRCESANLSRWMGAMPWSWWGGKSLSEAEQRSLVILSASFLKEQLTAEIVNNIYLQCQERLNSKWGKIS